MRVLHIVKSNKGAMWAFNQAKWLNMHGVDIITVLPSINEGTADLYINHNMKVLEADFSLPLFKIRKFYRRIKAIRKVVNDTQPDLIHCHFVTNILMIRIALKKIDLPRLFQVPGPLHLENFLYKKVELFFSDENDYWAGACKKTYDIYIKSGVDKSRVFLSYYGGYGGNACNEYKEKSNIIHNEFNIASGKILVGMVGYFYKPKKYLLQARGIKGHEDFIDAIALVRKANPQVLGVIIGDSWGNSHSYLKKVKVYAKKKCADGIIFTGFRTDLKKIYKELDIAVHPSHSENLGGAAESLAAEVPTISTNIGGFPDIVINGKTGYAVRSKSPTELAEAIIRMINDPNQANKMAKNGKEIVKDLLDIDNTAGNIKKIYYKLTGSNT